MEVFDAQKRKWICIWGETKLEATKIEENMAKYEDERRSVGSSIDCILRLATTNMDLMVVEVSGGNSKEEYDHFIKDRIKIAKNLKVMMKHIMRKKLIVGEISEVQLLGMQVYHNRLYLYALTMPLLNIFCFEQIMSFDIPTSLLLLPFFSFPSAPSLPLLPFRSFPSAPSLPLVPFCSFLSARSLLLVPFCSFPSAPSQVLEKYERSFTPRNPCCQRS